MRIRTTAVMAFLMGLVIAAAVAGPAGAADGTDGRGGALEFTFLRGAEEVGPGDPDAIGAALIRLDQRNGEVCYAIAVTRVDGTIVAAHIHRGARGTNGPVVVNFVPPADGFVHDCVAVAPALIAEIRTSPEGFYVNVHSSPNFPAGAVRGQLGR
jgi:hypothetical protein